MSKEEASAQRRLALSRANLQLSEAILSSDTELGILQALVDVAGPALDVDRALIYEVRFADDVAAALAEWVHPAHEITPTKAIYPLSLFRTAARELVRTLDPLESSREAVHPFLKQDGADALLHGEMRIRRLYWHPFIVREGAFYVLVLNMVVGDRAWTSEEIEFVRSVAAAVSLALMKIDLLREREANAAAQRESETRYRLLYDHTPSMFFTVDRAGSVKSLNAFAVEHLGYGATELLERPVLTVVHPDDRERVTQQLAQCFANPDEVRSIQFRKVCKDGSVIWVKETVRVTAQNGDAAALIVCEDITEAKRLEEATRQAQKLESLGVLASGIAHDFNNFLGSILGNAEIALRRLRPESPALPPLEKVTSATRRAADLVRQLLVYSGKSDVVTGPVDLNLLVAQMIDLLRVSVPKGVTIRFTPWEQPLVVEADEAQLGQVVMNLVVNAGESMRDTGGEIHVRAECLAAPGGRDRAILTVADRGKGMTAEVRSRIFDPFFTTKTAGRGLGLATVLGIVRAHGGTIDVDSEPSRGTTFRVELRCAGATASAPAQSRVA